MRTLELVDTNAVAQCYYKNRKIPYLTSIVDGEVIPTKALYGILCMFKIREPNSMLVFCADSHSFRKDLYDNYKATRLKEQNTYYRQLDIAKIILESSGFNYLKRDGYEADDLIASVVYNYYDKYDKIIVHTNDNDLAHVIDKQGKVMIRYITGGGLLNIDNYEDKLGIPYNTIVLYKALVGDRSDNIKGVMGFGDYSFKMLIEEIKGEYDLSEIRARNLEREIITKYIPKETQAQGLLALEQITPVIDTTIKIREDEPNYDMLKYWLDKYQMKSIIKAINKVAV